MASHRGRLQPMLEVHRQFCHMGYSMQCRCGLEVLTTRSSTRSTRREMGPNLTSARRVERNRRDMAEDEVAVAPQREVGQVEHTTVRTWMAPLTDLKMVVGFGMAAGVDHRVHESEPPWWYRDVLGAGLSLARRGGDRELMNGMLRSSLEQCQDEIFVAQATRWVQQLVEDLGRADGVDTHRELSHVPPAECELGDWAMHTMDVLIFEYQRKGGTDCGQGEAEVDGLPAPGSVRPRSRSPRRRTTVPPEDIHTVSDVVSLMETGGNGGHREERRHRGGEVAKPRPKTKARVPALRVKPGSCDHRCPGIPQPGQVRGMGREQTRERQALLRQEREAVLIDRLQDRRTMLGEKRGWPT